MIREAYALLISKFGLWPIGGNGLLTKAGEKEIEDGQNFLGHLALWKEVSLSKWRLTFISLS